ncbi:MAG: DUF2357 domain-containing protein [Gammaproteobacteria bacterium]|nr:DUF2357 domain-containing protein [Gammaproteobacteria bacterium]
MIADASTIGDIAVRRWDAGPDGPTHSGPIPQRLQTEWKWIVEGPEDALDDVAHALPRAAFTRPANRVLILNLVNSVGILDLPHIGPVELVTGKFQKDDFEAMLRDITEWSAALPFSADQPASFRYANSRVLRDEVVYHAFVYLRHILSDRAPGSSRLMPALQRIQMEPHRVWLMDRREVRIEIASRVDSRTLMDLIARSGRLVSQASLSPKGRALAERLGMRLPEVVTERRIRATTDTQENRFVKAFVGQATGIIARIRSATEARRPTSFGTRVLRDCERMMESLTPVVRHPMWDEVGRMTRIPYSSTVLQRRRGYRRVLRHWARIRLAPRIALNRDEMRDMLELKNIALLYELWTFHRLACCIDQLVGPPQRTGRMIGGDFQMDLARGKAFEWASGIRLAYNPTFSRGAAHVPNRSYSVELRPDAALWIPSGVNRGIHLFDAKFRLRSLSEAGATESSGGATTEKHDERKDDFKGADIHKMHTYRDAIRGARSAWILYPGSEFRFFTASGRGRVTSPGGLPDALLGVGAIPLAPSRENGAAGGRSGVETDSGPLEATVRRLLASRKDRGSPGRHLSSTMHSKVPTSV